MNEKDIFKIMVIDDNESIHHDFKKILKTEHADKLSRITGELFGESSEPISLPKFEIDVASQGKEGVTQIKAALDQGIHYALAFVDIRMPPGWNGIETIKHIWELDKNIQIVICTAYSDFSWEETIANLGKKDNLLILKKPFDTISVRQLACALTTKWQLAKDAQKYTSTLKQQVADRTLSLQKSLSLVKSTFESSSDGILVINNNGEIVDYNQNVVSMLQIPQPVLETKKQECFWDDIRTKLINPEDFFKQVNNKNYTSDEPSIHVIHFKNGKTFECYSQPHKLNNKIIGHIFDFRDITKRAKLEKELQHQATHDALTGLGNRIELFHGMREAIEASKKDHLNFAIIFLDLDRFKLINDSLSHLIGDKLLKDVAIRLRKAIRLEDTLARLGGDEFVVVLKNIADETQIQDKINKLIDAFKEPFVINNRLVTMTASLGVSLFPKDGSTVDILLRNADAAMYRAKARKGNNIQFYSPEMSSTSLAEFDQEMELRQAVNREEFFLCYHPQLDLTKEKVVALEALIRWNHPKKGILLPIDFIPLAEEIGLIVPIGEWALRTACKQNKAWQEQGLPPVRIAVNVSAEQFNQQNLVETIRTILKETELKPEYLELELTENVILSNKEIIRTIIELKKLGVMIAIDDFGTGYSSLSYLRKLPIDRLKIDGSFIQHIHSETDDEVIIRAVIAMAKNLNLEVLAEGVETSDQLNFLKKNQCDDAQGFYFGEPLSGVEAEFCLKNPEEIKRLAALVSDKEE